MVIHQRENYFQIIPLGILVILVLQFGLIQLGKYIRLYSLIEFILMIKLIWNRLDRWWMIQRWKFWKERDWRIDDWRFMIDDWRFMIDDWRILDCGLKNWWFMIAGSFSLSIDILSLAGLLELKLIINNWELRIENKLKG